MNTLFATAARRGVNICCASGDRGSSEGTNGLCVNFPSSSPNVIACGGTSLICPTLTYAGAGTVETVWGYSSSNGTGGGVSATFPLPTYQKGVTVRTSNSTTFIPTMRTVPDIAMNADPNTGVSFLIGGARVKYGGTSIVAPAMAAYITTLTNTGFLNPKLYSLSGDATCFRDVTVGSNGAYIASTGYDACTGLGSINGSGIKAAAKL